MGKTPMEKEIGKRVSTVQRVFRVRVNGGYEKEVGIFSKIFPSIPVCFDQHRIRDAGPPMYLPHRHAQVLLIVDFHQILRLASTNAHFPLCAPIEVCFIYFIDRLNHSTN